MSSEFAMRSIFPISMLFSVVALAAAPTRGAGAPRGALLYQTCTACHSVLGNGIGPDITGIYKQPAARRSSFRYSAALLASGLVWNEATLRAFLRNPQALVKGTTMTFPGYASDADLAAIVSYIKKQK
jgi:cytochrome c